MSRGNTIKPVRFGDQLRELIEAEIARLNATTSRRQKRPYDFGSWLRQAAIEKLKHSARSRGATTEELAELDAFPESGLSKLEVPQQ